MEFKLVDTETIREYRIGDAVIRYREALPVTVTAAYARHSLGTERGVEVDIEQVMRDILSAHVLGWEGVTLDGAPLPYSLDTLLRIRGVPDALFARIVGSVPAEDGGQSGERP
jgi:hypothetical protein